MNKGHNLGCIKRSLYADLGSTILLPIRRFAQTTGYSCVASVFQSVLHYMANKKISHQHAIDVLDCEPDGALLTDIPKVLRKKFGVPARSRQIKISQIRNAIDKKSPVIAADVKTWKDEHAVLVIGYNDDGYWVLDPLAIFPVFFNNKEFKRVHREFLRVYQ